ncbi:hypothetical protein FQA39_LY11834 [Lamprigera yunnana]|nr:hypothetical protein FQA39_LY11834 [Lamprigera yunnana]
MKLPFLLFALCSFGGNNALDTKDVVFIILSQSSNHNYVLAKELRDDIYKQGQILNQKTITVHFSHVDFPHVGGWTVLPLIPHLTHLYRNNRSWFFFVEDRSRILLKNTIEVLQKYDHNQEIWLGHAIYDNEATIIHHFAFFDDPKSFKYPNAASGFAISSSLMKRLENRWKTRKLSMSDFSIDYAHELALFIWNNNKGPILTHESSFCVHEESSCASFPIPFKLCNDVVPKSSIYFGIKTFEKFHEDRVRIVRETWGRHSDLIKFFSNIEDKSIPTISVGVPNTEQGHCGKTLAILKYVAEDIRKLPNIKWIAIVDDDTILSVRRLQEFLSCYNCSTLIALGERYGYNVYNEDGYNYITGGGGIVISRILLETLILAKICECPTLSSPDDMFLGACLSRLKIDISHSPFFHQARPVDYPPEYLTNQFVVSFHKHWMVDPIVVYTKWFSHADVKTHSEL